MVRDTRLSRASCLCESVSYSRHVPQPAKKKKVNRIRARKTKAAGAGLEDFMGIIVGEPDEEEEMSSLVASFAAPMRKWVAGSGGETTPRSDGKQSK